MNKPFLLFSFLIFFTALFAGTINKPVKSQYGFIENKGQIIDQNNHLNPSVLYLYNGNGLHVQLKQNGFSYEVWKVAKGAAGSQPLAVSKNPLPEAIPIAIGSQQLKANQQQPEADSIFIHRIDISFVGANPNAKITSFDPASDYINYYTTGTSEAGVINVHHYKKVLYQNIYPNIDVEFVLNENKFKYNFIIHPGGNPNDIQLKFDGANSTSLTSDEHITIETAYGNIDESIPMSYQLNEKNEQQLITSNFKLQTTNVFGLSVGKYDATKTLIIDPVPWATYFGGTDLDYGMAISSNKAGNRAITGYTGSTTSIATSGAYQTAWGGNYNTDAFLATFTPSGARVWSTYYGNTGYDDCEAIATDASGNIFITGRSTSYYNMTTVGAYQTGNAGGEDAIVVKFSPTGSRIWATFFGGSNLEEAFGIATDLPGNVYVIGRTMSTSGVASSGSYQTSFGGGEDAFIVKFTPTGSRSWSTYYGGTGYERGYGITADISGYIFVTGDPFIAKFNTSGTVQWASSFDGNYGAIGNGIASDMNGNVFVTGATYSDSSFASSGAFQNVFGGMEDAFVIKYNSSGVSQWATYFGGSSSEYGNAIATDLSGNIIITGTTISTAGIASTGAYQPVLAGYSNAFIAKFNSFGSRLFSTYYGGEVSDVGFGVMTDSSGNIFVVGNTTSTSGIATPGAFQTTFGGSSSYGDAFLAAFTSNGRLYPSIQFDTISGSQTICPGILPNTLTGSLPSGGNSIYAYKWLKSTLSMDSGYYNAGGNDTSQNYTPSILSNNTWYKRVVISGGNYDTSVAVAITMKLRSGFMANSLSQCLVGNNFTFLDTSYILSGTISRKWYFGTGLSDTSSLINPSKIYSSSGSYFVKLVTTGSNGCIDSVAKLVTINPKPTVGFTINNSAQCLGNNFSFADTSTISSGTISRQWNFGTGAIDTSTSSSPTKIYTSASIYTIKLLSISNYGCKDSINKTVTVYPKPIVGFSVNSVSQCITGNNFLFADTSSISSGTLARQWSFGTGANDTSTSISPTKIYTSANTYSVKLLSISNNGCKDSITRNVIVNPKPNAGFTINNLSQCINGNNFLFNDTSTIIGGTLTRKWNFGAGVSDTLSSINPSKVYASANTFSVKLVETSNNGCKDSITRNVTVNPKPTIGFTINNLSQCINGNNFLFVDTSIISNGTIIRQWNFGTGITDTSSTINPNKVYTNANTYSIKLVSISNNGCRDSLIKTINVHPKPNVGFTINNASQCLNGNNFLFNDTTTINGGTLTRQWNLGIGTIDTSTFLSLAKTYLSVGSYSVKIVSTSSFGCKDSIVKTVTVNPKPVVGFTINNSTQCFNGNVFLFADTSTISNGTLNRSWDFGNGANSSSINPSIIYATANTYSVKIVSTSNNGCKDSLTKTITVNPKPIVGFTINSPVQCINTNSFLFTDTSSISSGTFNRNWDFGNGTISSNINPSITYSTANTYQVKVVSTSNNGCKDSLTKTITVNPKPTVGFTINNSMQCVNGNSFLVNDTSTISSGTLTRNWDFGNGTSFININPTISYTIDSTYIIKLISTSNYGCKDSVSKTVTVYPKPIVGFTQNSLTQCFTGNNIVLNDTTRISSGTQNRVWNFGDATTSSTVNPTKSYTNAGTYQIKLVETSNNNCKDSIIKTFNIIQPKSGFTINSTSQCLIGNSFSFDDTSSTSVTRLWNLGDLTINTNDTLSKTYSNAGTYFVKLKIIDANNCSDSTTKTITVKASPAKPIITALTKSLLQSTVANSYQWYLNNTSITSAITQTLAITQNGNYAVKIDSTNGCSNLSDPFAASTVGVKEIIADNEIKIYPNPASTELYIETTSLEKLTVQLFDMTGKEVSSIISFSNTAIINTQTLSEGMYFVRITDANGAMVKTQKILILP